MALARNAARKDRNHAEIVARYRKNGATVLDVSQIAGALDLVIGLAGVDCRVEIKDGEKPQSARKLTEAEQRAFDTWDGRPPVLVETVADVDAHCDLIQGGG